MNKATKTALWVGLVAVVPGLWLGLIIRKIYTDLNEKEEFRRYVHKTYGYGSIYHNDLD